MKKSKFDIIYLNGEQTSFWCFGFNEAIILAMAYAISKGWDIRLKFVTDAESGVTIENIEFPTYTFTK